MRLASFLKRNRHGVFYLRWVIPSAQQGEHSGRGTEVAVSLPTTCPRHAAAISRDLSARWLWRLPAIRTAARSGDPAAAAMHAELRRAVATWVEQLYRGRAAANATADPSPPETGFVVRVPLLEVSATSQTRGRAWRRGHCRQIPYSPVLPTLRSLRRRQWRCRWRSRSRIR